MALPIVTAGAVFLFVCGSSSVRDLMRVGHAGRWVALVALLAVAVRRAYEQGARLCVDMAVAVAAALVVVLALLSSAWSVDPRLTVERSATLGILVVTALLVAQAVAGRRAEAERVLGGLVGGCVAVALAGLLVLALAHGDAVAPATAEVPARFRGMGQDPNTASLLFAVAMPAAIWLSVAAGSLRRRAGAALSLMLLFGSTVASGSHGALLAGGVGSVVIALLVYSRHRVRFAAALVVVAAIFFGFWVETLPQPKVSATATAASPSAIRVPPARPGYFNAEINTPLDGELGIPLPGHGFRRTLTTSSGRLQAWGGAIQQAAQRPIAGYGFGTESRVFVDRWSVFVGSVPEDSYIGIGLQLGLAGLFAFAGLLVALGRAGVRSLRMEGGSIAVAGLGVLAAALVAALGQSYVYSVGNVATVTVWVAAFLLASREPANG